MEKKTIGKFIAVLRKANGLTQADLAEKLFVSDKTVSRWERDESTPDLELIPIIADLFGVTSDELLRGERVPAPTILDKTQDETEQEKDKEKAVKNLQRQSNALFAERIFIFTRFSWGIFADFRLGRVVRRG